MRLTFCFMKGCWKWATLIDWWRFVVCRLRHRHPPGRHQVQPPCVAQWRAGVCQQPLCVHLRVHPGWVEWPQDLVQAHWGSLWPHHALGQRWPILRQHRGIDTTYVCPDSSGFCRPGRSSIHRRRFVLIFLAGSSAQHIFNFLSLAIESQFFNSPECS